MNTITDAQMQAQAVLNVIQNHPERHDQANWGEHTDCGTTMCVAGHIAYMNGVADFREVLEEPYRTILYMKPEIHMDFDDYAGDKLNLPEWDRELLFYDCNEDQAIEALEYIAAGKEIDWETIMEDD